MSRLHRPRPARRVAVQSMRWSVRPFFRAGRVPWPAAGETVHPDRPTVKKNILRSRIPETAISVRSTESLCYGFRNGLPVSRFYQPVDRCVRPALPAAPSSDPCLPVEPSPAWTRQVSHRTGLPHRRPRLRAQEDAPRTRRRADRDMRLGPSLPRLQTSESHPWPVPRPLTDFIHPAQPLPHPRALGTPAPVGSDPTRAPLTPDDRAVRLEPTHRLPASDCRRCSAVPAFDAPPPSLTLSPRPMYQGRAVCAGGTPSGQRGLKPDHVAGSADGPSRLSNREVHFEERSVITHASVPFHQSDRAPSSIVATSPSAT